MCLVLGYGEEKRLLSCAWKEDKSLPEQEEAGMPGLGNHRSQRARAGRALRGQGLRDPVTQSVGP